MKKIALFVTLSFALIACNHSTSERLITAFPDNETIPAGKVIKAGVFKVISSEGLVESPNTTTGKALSKPVLQMVKATNRIPLIRDALMSLQYRIWNVPDNHPYIKFRKVLIHPPMSLPDGSVTTGSEYMVNNQVITGEVIAYAGYGLNEDYEMIEGDWTFQVWHENDKLIEYTFKTYWPSEVEIRELGDFSSPAG